MCGIAGFWQAESSTDADEILTRMGNAIKHRGPNDSGQFFDCATGLGLAHRRLSILDLSVAGHQPMRSHSGRYTIVFNGEVYNFEDIRAELDQGIAWKGRSDTEVMLEAFDRWGIEGATNRFIGMFAFAVWDVRERKLHLVRDRLGIKPLFYGLVGGHFVFASELKAIRQYPGFANEIDRNALALYMRHNCIPCPHSIYAGIFKLPPGCILTMTSPQGEQQVRRYWSAVEVARRTFASPQSIDDTDFIEQLDTKLRDAIRMRMIADVPLGAFLSGGIDSSTVVALMQAQSNRPVRTFTIGFAQEEYDEAAHARRVAQHLGTHHTELYVTPEDALNVVPLFPSIYDEPFADASQIPTFLVSRLAREHVTVALSGDGGDELFAGYNRHYLTRSIWRSLKPFPRPLRKAAAACIHSIPPARIGATYRFGRSLLPQEKRCAISGDKIHKFARLLDAESPEAIYLRALSHWDEPTEIVQHSVEPDTVRGFIAQLSWMPGIEEAMMLTDLVNYLPDDILTKVDRASMAVSLEARVPLIDHKIVEFACGLPLRFKIRNGIGKWILRQVLYRYVPRDLVERPKMGFGVPIDSWLRGPLRQWAEDLLTTDALNRHGLLNPGPIRSKWQEHVSGKRNWQYLIWDVLMFQDWLQHNSRSVVPAVSS